MDEDQEDRRSNWQQLSNEELQAISARDRERNTRTREIATAGQLQTARDFANAALVMQHSGKFAGYRLAHEMALSSMLLGDRGRGRWLVAASYDRMLRSSGHDQRFGTQFSAAGLTPVDTVGISDKQRIALGCPTLQQAQSRNTARGGGIVEQLLKAGGVIEDEEYGVSLKLPHELVLKSGGRWGEKETTLMLELTTHPLVMPALYYRVHAAPRPPPEEGFEAYLRKAAAEKAADRMRQMPDYKNRADSFVFYRINGRPALSWMADFTRDGAHHSEYLTRVVGEKAVALFFTRGPAAEIDDIRTIIDAAAETLQLP